MTRANSLFIITTIAVTAALCPAAAEEEDGVWKPDQCEYRWYGVEYIVDFDNEWRQNFSGTLYEEPSKESPTVFEGFLEDVAIVDGASVIGKFDEPLRYGYREKYWAWYKIRPGDIDGWARRTSFYGQSVIDDAAVREDGKYRVVFLEGFFPLRERPDIFALPLRYLGDEIDGYAVDPHIEKGTVAHLLGRVDDWLVIASNPWDESWVRYDESKLAIYRLIYYEEFPPIDMYSDFAILVPIDDPFRTILLESWGYLDEGVREWLQDPKIVISTGDSDAVCKGEFLGYGSGRGSLYSRPSYFLFTLPEGVSRASIKSLTLYAGNAELPWFEGEFTREIDAKKVWGEFEE